MTQISEEQMMHEQIEKRAYEISLQHNGENGHELEDWLNAEEELNYGSNLPKTKAMGQRRTK